VLIEVETADTPRNDRLTKALAAAGFARTLRSTINQGGAVNEIFERTGARAAVEPSGEPLTP
jgi:hypothetical protein